MKISRLGCNPGEESGEKRMLLQGVAVIANRRQLRICEGRVHRLVADRMNWHGLFAAARFGAWVMPFNAHA